MSYKPRTAVWVGCDLWNSEPGVVAGRKFQAGLGSGLVAVWIVGSKAKAPRTVVNELAVRRTPTAREIIDGTAR